MKQFEVMVHGRMIIDSESKDEALKIAEEVLDESEFSSSVTDNDRVSMDLNLQPTEASPL